MNENDRIINIIKHLDIPKSYKFVLIVKLDHIDKIKLMKIILAYIRECKKADEVNNMNKQKLLNMIKDLAKIEEEIKDEEYADNLLLNL